MMSLSSDAVPIRHIPLSYSHEESRKSALRLILTLRPDWEDTQDLIEFVRFKEGITNTLLKAIHKEPGKSEEDIDNEAILLRAYGNGTAVLIDRDGETLSHSLLASHNLAPSLLARFENGLLYKYIQGTACAPEDLRRPEVWRGVARRIAEWHATLPVTKITSPPPSTDAPTGRPKPLATLDDAPPPKPGTRHNRTPSVVTGKPEPTVWSVMQKWIAAVPTSTPEEKSRQATLSKELVWLARTLGDTPGIHSAPLVFAHCDLLSGNVIISPPSQSTPTPSRRSSHSSASSTPTPQVTTVSFIDYEYTTAAPAAFDLANHFAEWGGFECDYAVLPTRSQRRDFLKEYLRAYNTHLARAPSEHETEGELRRLEEEVDMFRGVPGFYWGIWALIQATISQIHFDYAAYAEVRLGEYWAWKREEGVDVVEGEGESRHRLRERRWREE
ncbi:kinase-like protein [Patellaria atrata CBS 101060]|uniref:ethanolamine kinase n=1 Tax=Patellaria atrata CBS 101060 TaxID=1346257 RepID=A0A9P4SIG8_9PEZI|nr:kinase-like protein [Patellaria atrata CBS 101060]